MRLRNSYNLIYSTLLRLEVHKVSLKVFGIENNYYMLIEIEDRDTTMKKEKDNNKPLERKKYIPPSNHPWRKSYKK